MGGGIGRRAGHVEVQWGRSSTGDKQVYIAGFPLQVRILPQAPMKENNDPNRHVGDGTMKKELDKASENNQLLEIGRRAVEDALIDMRDSRMGMIGRGNGLVIREKDGSESSIIRIGTEQALAIGLKAMADSLA